MLLMVQRMPASPWRSVIRVGIASARVSLEKKRSGFGSNIINVLIENCGSYQIPVMKLANLYKCFGKPGGSAQVQGFLWEPKGFL